MICIDGLDEDIMNDSNWYDRINETIEIANKYKRIRFAFSAREYFYNNLRLPSYQKNYKELRKPKYNFKQKTEDGLQIN